MRLEKLSLINFKNIAQLELRLGEGINGFVGDNGAGKTNIIDAVYYLSMCKSALPTTDGQNIRHESDFFLVEGGYRTDEGKTEQVVCGEMIVTMPLWIPLFAIACLTSGVMLIKVGVPP